MRSSSGPEGAVSPLRAQLQQVIARGRAVHAYLLTGASAESLAELGLFLAQSLVCERRPGGPCGACSACRKVAEGNHPDVQQVRPSGASLKLQQMHDLQQQAWLRPTEAAGKVFIIHAAESMTVEAANSLLRILEDPPGEATFVLLSPQPQQLLPTILSRCQRLDAATPLPLPEAGLREEIRALVAKLSGLDELAVMDLAEAWDKERAQLDERVTALAGCYRDLLAWQQTGDAGLLLWTPDAAWFESEALRHSAAGLMGALTDCEACLRNLERNANPRLTAEVLLFRLRKA
ncbi:MAG: DNA polymerase III subunit [Symbiobacteriia bacterium]